MKFTKLGNRKWKKCGICGNWRFCEYKSLMPLEKMGLVDMMFQGLSITGKEEPMEQYCCKDCAVMEKL